MANRILQGGHWAIMGNSLSVHSWTQGLAIEDVNPYVITFWVQVSKLPLGKMCEASARKIGGTLC